MKGTKENSIVDLQARYNQETKQKARFKLGIHKKRRMKLQN
jgi:hypothetical protein